MDQDLQQAARGILELLAAFAGPETDLASDEQLNAALDPFRGRGPYPVHCGVVGCNRRVSWWALPVRGRPTLLGVREASARTPMPPGGRFGGQDAGVAETGFVYGNGLWPIEGARVVHSSWGPRRAEVRGEAGKSVQSWHPDPYKDWSFVRFGYHAHDAKLVDAGRLEYLFVCPRTACSETYTLTNRQMLALLVVAPGWGDEEIRLQPQGGRKAL